MLEPCVPLQRYDYFEVISIPYIPFWYIIQHLSSCNFTFSPPLDHLIRLKTMWIHSIIGKRAGVHICLCFSRVCTDSLRRCRLRSGQASESAKEAIENSPRGDTEKKRWQDLRGQDDRARMAARESSPFGQGEIWAGSGIAHRRSQRRETAHIRFQRR